MEIPTAGSDMPAQNATTRGAVAGASDLDLASAIASRNWRGLSSADAHQLLQQFGPNAVIEEQAHADRVIFNLVFIQHS